MAAPNSQGRTHGRSRFSGRALSLSRRLFRQEAIDHQRFGIWGAVALTLPKSYALVTGFIALSVLAMALFIATQSKHFARAGDRVEKAGRQAPEPAVSQPSIGFLFYEAARVELVPGGGLARQRRHITHPIQPKRLQRI